MSTKKAANVDLDAVLVAWPLRATDTTDRTAAVLRRLDDDSAAQGLSDDDLFAAPLPKATDESDLAPVPARDRDRDRQDLRDLEKLAQDLVPAAAKSAGVQRAAEAWKDDSGIVDLAAAAKADPGALVRAQTTPLASQSIFDDEEPLSRRRSDRPPVVARASTAPSDKVTRIAPAPAPRGRAVGYGLAALAAAAAIVLALRTPKPEPVASAPIAPAASEVAPAAPQPGVAPAPSPLAERGTDLDALPAAPEASTDRKLAAKPAARASAAATGDSHATNDPPVRPVAKEPSDTGDLNSAMQKEVGDDAVKPAAALGGNAGMGNVPQKPSQGAMTGALGGVLAQARSCLGPDDPISRAAIVFTSSGDVSSVTVSGAAAGKPAEECIKGALMKAKVQPFAEPTYTANITIRHN